MSLVAISGNASGTGTLTIAAPNTNSNFTLTLPTATGTVLSSADVATQANQEAGSSTTTLVTSGRQQLHPSAAKVWVRGNMSAGIGTSYNVSSLTDIGVGQVVVNFTVPFSAVTYALSATASSNSDIWGQQYPTAGVAAVGSCGLGFIVGSRSLADPDIFYAIFFGDQ
jgi:hypothetical protein